MSTIVKGHVVRLTHRGVPPGQTGVVVWVGKDGIGEPHAVVRWDVPGAPLMLVQAKNLAVKVITLSAESRLVRETPSPKRTNGSLANAIREFLATHPGATSRDVRTALGFSASTHLSTLAVRRDIVRAKRTDGLWHYSLRPSQPSSNSPTKKDE